MTAEAAQLLTQVGAILIGIAAALVAAATIWRFPPTRWLVRYLARGFVKPPADAVQQWLRRIIREETNDIREQVYPNGGSSLADKVQRQAMQLAYLNAAVSALYTERTERSTALDLDRALQEVDVLPGMRHPFDQATESTIDDDQSN